LIIKEGFKKYGNYADDNVDSYKYDCVIENSKTIEELDLLAKKFVSKELKGIRNE
jgi:hypothetical protein